MYIHVRPSAFKQVFYFLFFLFLYAYIYTQMYIHV